MYYRYHVFFCVNERAGGRTCCQNYNAKAVRDYAKQKIKQLNLAGEGDIRINAAGCLNRCSEGPTIVVYPDGVWYRYADQNDVDEIIEQHLCEGKVVERLRI